MTAVKVRITGQEVVTKELYTFQQRIIQVARNPVKAIGTRALNDALNRAKQRLTKYPRKAKYPIQWKSEAQRRFVMAKLRAEDNLPYQRSNRLKESWVASTQPARIEISNEAKDPTTGEFYSLYVIGQWQQPFHKNTGWNLASDRDDLYVIEPLIQMDEIDIGL